MQNIVSRLFIGSLVLAFTNLPCSGEERGSEVSEVAASCQS